MSNTTGTPTPANLVAGRRLQQSRNWHAKLFAEARTVREAPVLFLTVQSDGYENTK